MHKLLTLGLASLFLVVTGCQDTNTTGPLAGPDLHRVGNPGRNSARANTDHHADEDVFDMDDRFATEKGAIGSGIARTGSGSVEVEVDVQGLLAGHMYELKVTIGVGGDASLAGFDGASFGIVTFGPLTSNDEGEVEFKGDIDLLGLFGPGEYRLDFFVTHDHAEGPGSGDVGMFLTGLLGSEPLSACIPAPSFIMIEADD